MKITLTISFALLFVCSVFAQNKTQYPDIPRIDVHTHVANNYGGIEKYLELRNLLLKEYSADLSMWINLGGGKNPIRNLDSINLVSENRMLCAFSDFDPFHGLKYKPEDLINKREQGFIGFKIWYGPWYRKLKDGEKGFPYVDDPANEPMFAEMEELGVLAASLHIADPNGPFGNRTPWCADPVEYWREITGFYNVLKKHPDLKVVAAHSSWLICQDAQIDYLRFLLATFPNLSIDLAATFQYFDLVSYDNLRDFMIEYSDRILFGTDAGTWNTKEETQKRAAAYNRCFRILETDETIEGSFFGDKPIKGLNLPREVLEKIYYKNAVRIYPKVGERMSELGY
ncbi:MAG: amidohydrolase family protein [Bacteroidetes bacterium]|nr:amidohydrolase family protein [Bacteroidota bacterium]